MPPSISMPTGRRRPDVAVVGAGIAGLVATRALFRAGLTVTCLEARNRVGGRALDARAVGDRPGQHAIDLGASWFWPDEPRVHALVDELALQVFPHHTAGDALVQVGPGDVRRVRGNPLAGPSKRFVDGSQSLARALAATLPDGIVRLSTPVSRIEQRGERLTVHAADGVREVDAVVVALPPPLAAALITFDPPLPADVAAAARATPIWMGDIVKAVATFAAPTWREQGLAGTALSHVGPFREFHDHSGPDGTAAGLFGFAPSQSFAALEEAAIEEAFRTQLVEIFGGEVAEPRAVHVRDWSRSPYTSPPARNAHEPTQLPSDPTVAGYGDPRLQTGLLGGRVQWASTETATEFAGHLEGAIQAGERAAARLLHRVR